jgi:beta-glucanase (GH16 family)
MMKYLLVNFAAIISLNVFASCKKAETSKNPAPSNIVINATVSSDGSGNVDFTTTATNAVTYSYEFGNGEMQDVPTGAVTYKYATVGTIDYTVTVTAKNSAGLSASAKKTISVTVKPSIPSLVWSDEFDKNGAPDPTKWIYDRGTGASGWGNNELQYYTSRLENAVVENGILKIKAIKENYSGSAYTSARLLTRGKYEFKYGTVEIRAKVPAAVGTWPAVWMLGFDFPTVGWPACGETDILEHRGSELNTIVAALHYPGRSGGNPVKGQTVIQNASTEFHLYKFEWTSSTLQFYVDNKLFHTVANSTAIPYNKNFFFLVNLAMGGGFGGPVDPAFTNATFEVDYIRVYK